MPHLLLAVINWVFDFIAHLSVLSLDYSFRILQKLLSYLHALYLQLVIL